MNDLDELEHAIEDGEWMPDSSDVLDMIREIRGLRAQNALFAQLLQLPSRNPYVVRAHTKDTA